MRLVFVGTPSPVKIPAFDRHLDGWDAGGTTVDVSFDAREEGASFVAIAIAKAEAVSARLPVGIVVATDGGLLIPDELATQLDSWMRLGVV